ncbi:hypothetical protein B0H65DRAFT_200936 [Neurospora tetraspora]|uniref:Uncharacterized protein n=1 Tax=Neurospora tetraspora TaxID=94610 RepID=A0AAE0JFX0_9PEZI|nr:hypothetical protein B0H65DRAFT_200936 [Neurospora tetraspora]
MKLNSCGPKVQCFYVEVAWPSCRARALRGRGFADAVLKIERGAALTRVFRFPVPVHARGERGDRRRKTGRRPGHNHAEHLRRQHHMHVSAIACVSRDSGCQTRSQHRDVKTAVQPHVEVDTCIDVTEPFGPLGLSPTHPGKPPLLTGVETLLRPFQKTMLELPIVGRGRSIGMRLHPPLKTDEPACAMRSVACPRHSVLSRSSSMFFVEPSGSHGNGASRMEHATDSRASSNIPGGCGSKVSGS